MVLNIFFFILLQIPVEFDEENVPTLNIKSKINLKTDHFD